MEALLANLEHARLDLVEEDSYIALLVMGTGDILGAGRDDTAEEIFFENDLAVVIGIRRRRDESKKLGNGDRAANLIEHAPVLERLGERDEVDRLPPISHLDQKLENFLVGRQMEMPRLHLGHGVVQRRGRVQNRAQEPFLGIETLRQRATGVWKIGCSALLIIWFLFPASLACGITV